MATASYLCICKLQSAFRGQSMGIYIYATSKNICEQKALLTTHGNYSIYMDIFTIPFLKYFSARNVISDSESKSTSNLKIKQ